MKEVAGRARAEAESVLARRLVREYENNGTGWFWETDRRGRLTYLSEKVVKELSVGRERVIGSALVRNIRSRRRSCGYRAEPDLSSVVADQLFGIFGSGARRDDRTLVVDLGPADDRSDRPVPGLHRHRQRSHRQAPLGSRDHQARSVRQPDQPRQPPAHAARARPGAVAPERRLPADLALPSRPRPVQGGQRHARPPGRRRIAQAGGAAAPARDRRCRPGRPARRRRVQGRAPGRERSRAAGQARQGRHRFRLASLRDQRHLDLDRYVAAESRSPRTMATHPRP